MGQFQFPRPVLFAHQLRPGLPHRLAVSPRPRARGFPPAMSGPAPAAKACFVWRLARLPSRGSGPRLGSQISSLFQGRDGDVWVGGNGMLGRLQLYRTGLAVLLRCRGLAARSRARLCRGCQWHPVDRHRQQRPVHVVGRKNFPRRFTRQGYLLTAGGWGRDSLGRHRRPRPCPVSKRFLENLYQTGRPD